LSTFLQAQDTLGPADSRRRAFPSCRGWAGLTLLVGYCALGPLRKQLKRKEQAGARQR